MEESSAGDVPHLGTYLGPGAVAPAGCGAEPREEKIWVVNVGGSGGGGSGGGDGGSDSRVAMVAAIAASDERRRRR